MGQASPYPWIASVAFALLLLGFGLRRRSRGWHALLMSAGMALDLTLVLVLEFTKDAIATAIGPSLSLYQHAHVLSSTMAVLFYFPVFALGLIRLKKPDSSMNLRRWHMRLGYGALAFRSIGFLFMFSMLGKK